MSYIGHFYNNKGYVVSLYRSPGQTSDEFYSFVNNLEKLMTDIYSQKADFVLIMLNHAIGQLMIPQFQREPT